MKKFWGYDAFREPQAEVIQSVISGKDTFALLPTGAGKSICYQVPGMILEGVTIVISPLIALMKDQVAQLHLRHIRAEVVYSGMHYAQIDRILDNCVYGQVKFLYVSPERLKSELFQERLQKMDVSFVAIDEAHCVSQWGYDFRPSYLEIANLRNQLPEKIPFLAVTATATKEVVEDTIAKLTLKNTQKFKSSFTRPNLSFSVFKTENKLDRIVEVLHKVTGTAIIYVSTRKQTLSVSQFLNRNKFLASPYHAGLPDRIKDETQSNWQLGKIRVIVATNAFGMGIDKGDVRLVIHFNPTDSIEAYYQEAGRAGRDGKKAYAVILFDEQDKLISIDLLNKRMPDKATCQKVYTALGNFYNLAIGSQPKESLPFELNSFCQKYNFDAFETYHVLKQLEQNEVISLNESFYQPSKLLFKVDKKELYTYQVAKHEFDKLIKTVLRVYGGEIFTSYMTIHEKKIAEVSQLPLNKIGQILKSFEEQNIASYIPQYEGSKITFLISRIDTKYLPFDSERYQFLKQRMKKRLEDMHEYLSLTTICRTVFFASYFGDFSVANCGICDHCLDNKKLEQLATVKKEIIRYFSKFQDKDSFEIEEVTIYLSAYPSERVLSAIRGLVAEGKLRLEREKLFLL